mmetsp:Transcript_19971/g.55599  ORF Transcript_19971/g.55599 Transcript_19971/m.55599 type:complete len:209 (+) Transcript_19971:2023-2649(+)
MNVGLGLAQFSFKGLDTADVKVIHRRVVRSDAAVVRRRKFVDSPVVHVGHGTIEFQNRVVQGRFVCTTTTTTSVVSTECPSHYRVAQRQRRRRQRRRKGIRRVNVRRHALASRMQNHTSKAVVHHHNLVHLTRVQEMISKVHKGDFPTVATTLVVIFVRFEKVVCRRNHEQQGNHCRYVLRFVVFGRRNPRPTFLSFPLLAVVLVLVL